MGLLEILIVVFFIIWLFGTVAMPVAGSAIHVLLVLVVVLAVYRLLQGRSL